MHENLPPGVNSGTSVLSKCEISQIREIKLPQKYMSHGIKKAAKVQTPLSLRWSRYGYLSFIILLRNVI